MASVKIEENCINSDNEQKGKCIVTLESDDNEHHNHQPAAGTDLCVPWGRNVEELPGTVAAIAAAKNYQVGLKDGQKERSFMKVLSSSSAKGNLLPFPAEFSRKYMPLGENTLTLIDESGRSWPAKWSWKPGQSHPGINAKWKPFCVHHHLIRGDVCLLHLVDPVGLSFKVLFFRRKNSGNGTGGSEGGGGVKRGSYDSSLDSPQICKARRMIKQTPDHLQMLNKDNGDENESAEELDGGADEEVGKKSEIRVTLGRCRSASAAETMDVKLTLQDEKAERIQKLLLGSANTTVEGNHRPGMLNAVLTKNELVRILKLAFPLDDSTPV